MVDLPRIKEELAQPVLSILIIPGKCGLLASNEIVYFACTGDPA